MDEKKVNVLMSWVQDEIPLSLEYETDCRTIWPKRWELLRRKLHLIDNDELKNNN